MTRKFKLKATALNEDLLIYIRIKLIKFYKGDDICDILITYPSNLGFEVEVIKSYLDLIKKIAVQVKSYEW